MNKEHEEKESPEFEAGEQEGRREYQHEKNESPEFEAGEREGAREAAKEKEDIHKPHESMNKFDVNHNVPCKDEGRRTL